MAKLSVLKPREVVARLEKLGFDEARQRGSHKQFRHSDFERMKSHLCGKHHALL